MGESELIAKQQIEIENLKEELNELYEAMQFIYNGLYNIGAPLNDNVLGFDFSQRKYLRTHIARNIILKDEQ